MLISDIALKRPVASIVMSLIIILFGVVGYNFLGGTTLSGHRPTQH